MFMCIHKCSSERECKALQNAANAPDSTYVNTYIVYIYMCVYIYIGVYVYIY